MKRNKKIVFIFITIIIIWYFWYHKLFQTSQQMSVWNNFSINQVTVESEEIISWIQLNWKTKIKNEQVIKFNQTWRVHEVHFQSWDEIKKWETIVKIDDTKAQNEIQKAQLSLQNAQLKLKKYEDNLENITLKRLQLDLENLKSNITTQKAQLEFLEKNTAQEIEKKYLFVKQSENNYAILEKEVQKNIAWFKLTDEQKENIINSKKLEIQNLEIEFNKLNNNFEKELEKSINSYLLTLETQYYYLEGQITYLDNVIVDANKIFWYKWEDKFEHYNLLSWKDNSYKNNAKWYLYWLNSQYESFKKSFKNIKNKHDTENIILTLKTEKQLQQELAQFANNMVSAFENSIDSIDFSLGEISSYSGQYSWIYSSATSKITSLQNTIDELETNDSKEKIEQDLKNKLSNLKNSISQAKIDITQIEENQNFLTSTVEKNIENEKLKLKISQKELEQTKLDFQQFNISSKEEINKARISLQSQELELEEKVKEKNELLEKNKNEDYLFLVNDVKQQKVQLEDAYANLQDYFLQAPFDGIITKIDIKTWDRLTPDSQNSVSIVDPNTIEIHTSVSQSDIVKVSQGMEVEIQLDAYEGKTFTGSITEIDTTPEEQNGISKFKTVVSLNNPDNLQLFSGMQANLTIKLKDIPQWPVIPFMAVSSDPDWKKFVNKIWENWESIKTYIEVGYTDGNVYQVIDWLEVWDTIEQINIDMSQFENNFNF